MSRGEGLTGPWWVAWWGQNVKARRESLEMAQVALAKKADTTQQTISRIEGGRQEPSTELKLAVARGLGSSVGQLFPNPDDESPRHRVMRKMAA